MCSILTSSALSGLAAAVSALVEGKNFQTAVYRAQAGALTGASEGAIGFGFGRIFLKLAKLFRAIPAVSFQFTEESGQKAFEYTNKYFKIGDSIMESSKQYAKTGDLVKAYVW